MWHPRLGRHCCCGNKQATVVSCLGFNNGSQTIWVNFFTTDMDCVWSFTYQVSYKRANDQPDVKRRSPFVLNRMFMFTHNCYGVFYRNTSQNHKYSRFDQSLSTEELFECLKPDRMASSVLSLNPRLAPASSFLFYDFRSF